MSTRTTSILLTALLAVFADTPATELPAATPSTKPGPAWGSQDVQPTPENPVYFRWTLGHFPGAQPPLEFQDGTPTTREAEYPDRHNPKVMRKKMIPDFADQKSKNVQWKARVPGWGLSHPIVVGKKVFAVGHPDFVTCWDLETGKQLWERRIMPLMLEGLPYEKVPARPALPEEQAAKAQKLIDLAQALWTVTAGGPGVGASCQPNNMYGGGPLEKKKDFAAKICSMAKRCRPDVEAHGDAALVSALDKDIASLERFSGIADEEALKANVSKERYGATNYWKAVSKAFSVPFGFAWYGEVGYADSTLASDGERIYGVFDQGQVFCVDLDGKVLWGLRDQVMRDNRATFHRSPTLCQGLLLVSGYNKSNKPNTMRAFEVKTGKLRWESPFPGSNYAVARVVSLARSTGEIVPVLVGHNAPDATNGVPILRISDGIKVGALPQSDCARGLLLGVVDDVIMFSSTSDRGGGNNAAYRLKWTGPDSATTQELFLKQGKDRPWANQAQFPTVFDKYWLSSGPGASIWYDATTGERVGLFKCEVYFPVVAGHYLIGMAEHTGSENRGRSDNKAMARFVIVDVKDPANPKMVSDKNWLGFAEPPSDIFIEQYYKDIDPFQFVGCYAGAVSQFMRMGGPIAVGKRLLIPTPAFMYCIGEK